MTVSPTTSAEARGTRDAPSAIPAERSTATRDFVLLAVNGVLREIRGEAALGTLSDYLREQLRLTGTKIVCSEGDCGACTVLVGELVGPRGESRSEEAAGSEPRFSYRTVDACIAFVYQFDGCHVITVDGLAKAKNAQRVEDLHPAQRAMAENYGSQCGFCTPGFVMALTGLIEESDARAQPADEEIAASLSGNLCRCTGYVQIVEAARAIEFPRAPRCGDLFDDAGLGASLASNAGQAVVVTAAGRRMEIARSAEHALEVRARRPGSRVVAGATDLGVRFNKGLEDNEDWIHLPRGLEGFGEARRDGRFLHLGALLNWSEVEQVLRQQLPGCDLLEVLERFGGPQIRNMGTVGGNLINASPIADSVPFFMVCEAELELVSQRATRTVPITDFYRGYKTFDLAEDELLRSVRLELPDPARGERVLLLKASRRRDLDISTFTAALWLRVTEDRVAEARLAYGGVAPTVVRLPDAERALAGAVVDSGEESRQAFTRAGEAAADAIEPISDVRGAAAYRRLLARNVMLRFHARCTGSTAERDADETDSVGTSAEEDR